jgi:hypothetical protein
VTVSTEPQATAEDRPPARPRPAADALLRVAGLVVALVATVLTAVAELYLTPLRVGGVPIGVGVLFAAAANWGIAWFAVQTTGRRWASGPPWALWTVIMIFAAGARTPEGDYLLSGNDWIALVMILVGSLVFAVHAYRMILHRPAP